MSSTWPGLRIKELPEKIENLERRIARLGEDIATAKAHERDPVTIGQRRCAKEDVHEVLEARLKGVSMNPWKRENVALGMYRGLTFGLDLAPHQNPAVYVEGAVTRFEPLSRDHHGPRAIMNAVTRLVDGYEDEQRRAAKELDISRGQLRDYQSRIGGTFQHGAYLEELHGLRDQLERALSDKPGEADQGEIVARIKALREAHTVEAAPERTKRQAASIEEAVTTRIMWGRETEPAKVEKPEQIEMPVQSAEIMRFKKPVANKPKATHREKVEGEKRQLSLF